MLAYIHYSTMLLSEYLYGSSSSALTVLRPVCLSQLTQHLIADMTESQACSSEPHDSNAFSHFVWTVA